MMDVTGRLGAPVPPDGHLGNVLDTAEEGSRLKVMISYTLVLH